jgi:hypothetical protein
LNPLKNFHAFACSQEAQDDLKIGPNNYSYKTLSGDFDLLHGTGVAMYIVGQERRLVNPPSQVVAGVRTVTTKMNGRDALPRMSRPFAFFASLKTSFKVFSAPHPAHAT